MSAGVCGKRVGFEELFGSSSPTNKRSKCSSFGSPVRSPELGSGSDDPVSVLIRMFPSMDPEFVRKVLNNKNNEFEEAKESLRTISFGGGMDHQTNVSSFDTEAAGICGEMRGGETATCSQMPEHEAGMRKTPTFDNKNVTDGAKWVDLLVSEMANATNIDDAKRRAAGILQALERTISQNSKTEKELEYASLKERLQSLINDNQILKRVVAIQHERVSEQEEKAKELKHLKVVIGQYQEQVHKLELSNYAMKLHLQRSQPHSSFPGNLPPDVY
ncbi:PREDICTED: uncharacterized protein LOC104823253 isoform X2 [Tarenaya hassleriana]|uniref:uncharacterized protein LOC104823253 isoform X2 n=1 Tax=Tarenaya hassleriana TaxID=28532 RepID=UPI00053C6DC8|nr:PREDICTED: uncharacterized protein LOC104823253 isoform X2 [Tarenaya hassleriana]